MSDIEKKGKDTETAPFNPFKSNIKTNNINQGAVAIEAERAIADVKAKLMIAKSFPRDEHEVFAAVVESCRRPAMAEQSEYAFPRGGQTVRGASIRLMEEMARKWGNIEFGIRELSQKDGYSEMEAYAWDLESNVRSSKQFTVTHTRDSKKEGKVALTDDRDIYEKTANYGARRLRSVLQAVLPPELEQIALSECRKTKEGNNTLPLTDRINAFLREMSKLNVSKELIEQRLGYSVDQMTEDDLGEYKAIYLSLKEHMTKVTDWFETGKAITEKAKKLNEQLNATKEATEEKPQ